MNKLLLILIFLFLSSLFSLGQAQEKEAKKYKNALTFNVTRVLLLEARLGYERYITERHAIRITAGYKFPTSAQSYKPLNTWLPIPVYFKVTQGPYFSLGYAYYIIPKAHFYFSPEIYLNYVFFDKKYYEFCAGTVDDSYVSLQSRHLTKSGIKFLIGKKGSLIPHKKTRLQFDFFAGIGIQNRNEDMTIYAKKQGYCSAGKLDEQSYYDTPKKEHKAYWQLTLHGGILLSYPF